MKKIWILFLFFVGCTVQPPDIYVFENLGQILETDPKTGHTVLIPSPNCMLKINEPSCGHGVAIVSGNEIFVGEDSEHWYNHKPWSILKQQSIYLPAVESYAPLSQYVINSCEKLHCQTSIDRFKIKLNSLNGISSLLSF